jgi:hypothetical protein
MKAAVEKEQAASASVEHPWRWRKGESGNPAGRPNGSRNKATILGEMLLEQDVEAPVRLAVKTALEGDKALLRFCLSRLLPPARHRAVEFDLPNTAGMSPARAAEASLGAVLRAVAADEIAPAEAKIIADVIERCRRAGEQAAAADGKAAAKPHRPAETPRPPATAPAAKPAPGRRKTAIASVFPLVFPECPPLAAAAATGAATAPSPRASLLAGVSQLPGILESAA